MRVASGGRGSYTGNMYPPYPRTPFFAFFPVFFGVNRGYVAHFVCTPDVPPTYPRRTPEMAHIDKAYS